MPRHATFPLRDPASTWGTVNKEEEGLNDARLHGEQVFLYHGEYLSGQPKLDQKELVDYAWVTRDELQEYLSPEFFGFIRDILPTY